MVSESYWMKSLKIIIGEVISTLLAIVPRSNGYYQRWNFEQTSSKNPVFRAHHFLLFLKELSVSPIITADMCKAASKIKITFFT